VGFQHESRRAETLGYQRVWQESRSSDRVADEVIRFLHSSDAGGPFFLSVGLEEVHLPFDRPRYRFDEPEKVALPSFLPDNEHNRRQMAMFHGAIRFMDLHVGRMLSALEDSPARDATVVVFTTDHGMAFPRAKSTLYDAGIGTALLVRMPPGAGATGAVRDQLLSAIDLRPTLCRLAGISSGTDVQGRSFAGLLTGGEFHKRTEAFSEKNYHNHYDPIRCVIARGCKYIRNLRDAPNLLLPSDIAEAFPPRSRRPDSYAPRPKEELYNLSADPGEENNLADSPAHQAICGQLRDRLQQWMEQTADPLLTMEVIPYPPEQFAR
jgi:arylsulfatase A-like enzyme